MTRRRQVFALLSLAIVAVLAGSVRAPAAVSHPVLVLQAADVPGLKQTRTSAGAAVKAVEAALRPARLPVLGDVQAAHFRGPRTEVWSLVILAKTPGAATRAVDRIAQSARLAHLLTVRVDVGERSWLVQQRGGPAVVVWRHARGIGAVAVRAPYPAAALRTAAAGYAATADARLARLGESAWQRSLDEIRPDGTITRSTALKLFALAYSPLPGTPRPAGAASDPHTSPLVAVRAVLGVWPTLSAAQRRAVEHDLGVTGIALGKQRRPSGRPSSRTSQPNYGDPAFRRDPRVEAAARHWVTVFQHRMGITRPLRFSVVAGASANATGLADTLPIDVSNGRLADSATVCRIRAKPGLFASAGATFTNLVLAHEAFHCWQNDLMTPTGALVVNRRNWLLEGGADFAALTVDPVSYGVGGGNLTTYLGSPATPLFARTYDAVGFFGHLEESIGPVLPRMPGILAAATSEGNYLVAGGTLSQFLNSWSSSAFNAPRLGMEWTMFSPLRLPETPPAPTTVVLPGSAAEVSAAPYALAHYIVDRTAYPESTPLLHFTVGPWARLGNTSGIDTTSLEDRWFCTRSECRCPEGKEGDPPPSTPLGSTKSALVLTGGVSGSRGRVVPASLDEYCKEKEKPPTPPTPPSPITNTGPGGPGGGNPGGSGPSGGAGCDSGCGGSNGDPHLTTVDGVFYDFQGAGEYTLLKSRTDMLEVQARQEPYPGSDYLSVNTAVAMRVAGDRVVVSRGDPLAVRVNRLGFVPAKAARRLPGGGAIRAVAGQVEVSWPDGTVARVWSVGRWGVAVLVKPSAQRRGQLAGLLGNFDGDPEDDFATRGGLRLERAKVLASPALLYRTFGDSWRVSRQGSLFDYAPGQSTRTFTVRDFPKGPVTAASLPPQVRARAEKVCRRLAIVDPRILDACIVDVAGTGDYAFATAAAELQLTGKSFRAGAAAPAWKPLATGGTSNSYVPSVAVTGGTAVVAYTLDGKTAEAAEFPVTDGSIGNVTRVPLATRWDSVQDPLLLPTPEGGLQALLSGYPPGSGTRGVWASIMGAGGAFGAPAAITTKAGDVGGGAVLGPDGSPLWVQSVSGTFSAWHGAASNDLRAAFRSSVYAQTIGRDGAGRYWVAWYSLGEQGVPAGVYLLRIDPTSLQPIGAAVRAPNSAGLSNSALRTSLACATTCRVAYVETVKGKTRVSTWAQGEPAATVVAAASPAPWLTASYTPRGRLWVAWADTKSGRIVAHLGDARGAGGRSVGLRGPLARGGGFSLASAATDKGLVLVSHWQVAAQTFTRFATFVPA